MKIKNHGPGVVHLIDTRTQSVFWILQPGEDVEFGPVDSSTVLAKSVGLDSVVEMSEEQSGKLSS